MRAAPSLAFRLALYLFGALVVGAIITTIGIELFVEDDTLVFLSKNRDELAVPRINNLLLDSLHRAPDGKLVIEPTPGLRAVLTRTPPTLVAAFDARTGTPIEGSSPALVRELFGMRKIRTSHMHFRLRDGDQSDLVGHMLVAGTPFGPIALASYGHRFEWIDVLLTLHYEMISYLRYFLLAAILAVAVAWIGFKRGLSPLNKVAREAELIDLDSLHQRLPIQDVPAEVVPLVSSMNKALQRIDEGAERQRRFLANAAHELRTPVAILMERLDEPPGQGGIVKLRNDAQRIWNIVEQLLASARLDRSESRADETLDLNVVVELIVDSLALLAVKMKKGLDFERCEDAQIVSADRLALQSIVTNLIHNALRSEPVDGRVVVKVCREQSVEVVDHGAGVAAADREIIFEPFWRKNEATPGTGLGLAIAKELIEKHGGRIWVEETPGGGATFKLSLRKAEKSLLAQLPKEA
jgi:signal transduction histidine kinase